MSIDDIFGTGVIMPFNVTSKGDVASGSGADNLRASVAQILGTRATMAAIPGELRWRPRFGSQLHLLRHRGNDSNAAAEARVMVLDALDRWEPRVEVTDVQVEQDRSTGRMTIRVAYVPRGDARDSQVVPEQIAEVSL